MIGTAQEFKRKFETPILRGRDASSTDAEHKKGQERLQEVIKETDFMTFGRSAFREEIVSRHGNINNMEKCIVRALMFTNFKFIIGVYQQ